MSVYLYSGMETTRNVINLQLQMKAEVLLLGKKLSDQLQSRGLERKKERQRECDRRLRMRSSGDGGAFYTNPLPLPGCTTETAGLNKSRRTHGS